MEGNWNVVCAGKVIGACTVSREGLYYHFRCKCGVVFDKVCCLHLRQGNRSENLGVLVPMDGGFGLDTKVAAKRFGDEPPSFAAAPKESALRGNFIAVRPEEPFTHLQRLREAYFARREGQIGVIIGEREVE